MTKSKTNGIMELAMSKATVQTVMFRGNPINLSEISRSTGISVSHLSLIFAGRRTPSLTVAKKIADYLNVGLDELVAQ